MLGSSLGLDIVIDPYKQDAPLSDSLDHLKLNELLLIENQLYSIIYDMNKYLMNMEKMILGTTFHTSEHFGCNLKKWS